MFILLHANAIEFAVLRNCCNVATGKQDGACAHAQSALSRAAALRALPRGTRRKVLSESALPVWYLFRHLIDASLQQYKWNRSWIKFERQHTPERV